MASAWHCSCSRLLLKILEFAGKWFAELRCFFVFTIRVLFTMGTACAGVLAVAGSRSRLLRSDESFTAGLVRTVGDSSTFWV